MNTKRLGNIGEIKTIAKLVEMQIPVYQAFGDIEKADLVADFNGKLNKIQVKTSEIFENGSFIVDLTSSTIRKKLDYKHKYSSNEIDYFAIYNLGADMLLLLPIEEFEGRTSVKINIPYKPSRNQFKAINWEDYTFDKIISVETLHGTSSDEDEDKVQTAIENDSSLGD